MIFWRNFVKPITYIKNVSKALILAFTSRSSLGTLPVTIESLTDNVGVESGTASFIGSLGSNMGLNGCSGIYPALMIVTIANMAGINMDFSFYAMALIVITISSLGIAGLPGTATMAVGMPSPAFETTPASVPPPATLFICHGILLSFAVRVREETSILSGVATLSIKVMAGPFPRDVMERAGSVGKISAEKVDSSTTA